MKTLDFRPSLLESEKFNAATYNTRKWKASYRILCHAALRYQKAKRYVREGWVESKNRKKKGRYPLPPPRYPPLGHLLISEQGASVV